MLSLPRLLASTLLALGLLGLAACGGRASSTTTDGGATPAPTTSGGGVCCPIASDPCGACNDGLGGGWAPNAAVCNPNPNAACDGMLAIVDDDHGCPVIASGDSVPGAVCCGCPTPIRPTCTLSGSVWQCPPAYGGAIAACEGNPVIGSPCDADAGSCFTCQQGAGVGCSCAPGGADGGSTWVCLGSGVACQ